MSNDDMPQDLFVRTSEPKYFAYQGMSKNTVSKMLDDTGVSGYVFIGGDALKQECDALAATWQQQQKA